MLILEKHDLKIRVIEQIRYKKFSFCIVCIYKWNLECRHDIECIYFCEWIALGILNPFLAGVDYRTEKNVKRCLVVQNLKMAWSKRFIPKLFVWHSSSLQTKRIRLLLEDLLNLLKFPLVDCSNVSTKSKLHLQPMTTRLFLSPKPFLIGHSFNQWNLFFSVYKPVRSYLHFILTISLEECQTKRFGMNLLLHAIWKECSRTIKDQKSVHKVYGTCNLNQTRNQVGEIRAAPDISCIILSF